MRTMRVGACRASCYFPLSTGSTRLTSGEDAYSDLKWGQIGSDIKLFRQEFLLDQSPIAQRGDLNDDRETERSSASFKQGKLRFGETGHFLHLNSQNGPFTNGLTQKIDSHLEEFLWINFYTIITMNQLPLSSHNAWRPNYTRAQLLSRSCANGIGGRKLADLCSSNSIYK